MAVIQKFIYTWPEGTTPIHLAPWVATLTQAEQDEFIQAQERQKAFRQKLIDEELLELVDEGYQWKDKTTLDIGKPTDPIWLIYWNRWIRETGVIFSIEVIE